MYSIEDRYTFENLQEWIENTQDTIDLDTFVWALVGNKSDLPLEIEHDTIKSRCVQLGTELSFFVSAKTGENVVNALEKTVQEVHKRKGKKEETRSKDIIKPVATRSTQQKKGCC